MTYVIEDGAPLYEFSRNQICVTFATSSNFLFKLAVFSHKLLHKNLSNITESLNTTSTRCLKMLHVYTLDMSRYMKITPKRVSYVKDHEKKLYSCLLEITTEKEKVNA